MWITRLSVERPIAILMVIGAILLLGVFGYTRMPVELDPPIALPVVNIGTVYAGATARQVGERVTRPIEDAVASINGVETVDSISLENFSNVTVRFLSGTNPDTAAAEVKARVEAARRDLPPDVSSPVVAKVDVNAQPVLVLGARLPGNRAQVPDVEMAVLRRRVEDDLQALLSQVPGVAGVRVVGGREPEIQVRADPAKLQQAGLAVTDLVTALRANGLTVPAGSLERGGREDRVRVDAEFNSLNQIRSVPVYGSRPGGGAQGGGQGMTSPAAAAAAAIQPPVLLEEVATVRDTTAKPEQIVRVGGADALIITVTRMADANTVQVVDEVLRQLKAAPDVTFNGTPSAARIGKQPIEVRVLQDNSEKVHDALEDINLSLVLGSLLAVLVVFLFLNSARDTLIIAIAIPTSIIATFGVMWMAGFSLNQMTMLALSLSVGILVDDSILVLESIHRHRQMGKPPAQAALDGRQEIGLANVTNTLADVVVFVPVALMGGTIGMYFKQFGLTVATATLFSMYVSFTLTPMLTARWFRPGEELHPEVKGFPRWFNRQFERLEWSYRRGLAWALRHRALVVTAGFGSLAVALMLAYTRLGSDFVPSVDAGKVRVAIEMPLGTGLETTAKAAEQITALLKSDPELSRNVDYDRSFYTVGELSGAGDRLPERGSGFGEIQVQLKERPGFLASLLPWLAPRDSRQHSDQEVAARLEEALASVQLPSQAHVTVTALRDLSRSQSAIVLNLIGHDNSEQEQQRLQRAASFLAGELRQAAGPDGKAALRNVATSFRPGQKELSVQVDRERAAELRVAPAEIGQLARVALTGNTDTRIRKAELVYPVRVQVDPAMLGDSRDLGELVVASRGDAPIYLDEVAKISWVSSENRLIRRNRRPMVKITADRADGVDLATAQEAAKKRVDRLRDEDAPALRGFSKAEIDWGGEYSGMSRALASASWALIFAIALTYMLLAALFNSFVHPLTIMLSVPMAVVGAILALLVTGSSMSVVAMVGVIMLVGLVAKNAILLVDYTNTLRQRDGMRRQAAILTAGPVRLRPIVMTTTAMVLAMLPIALRLGRASEIRAPMAIVVIGGLLLSTLLTLFIIPCVYTFLDDLTESIQSLWRRRVPHAPPSADGNGHREADLDHTLSRPEEAEKAGRDA